MSIYDEQEVNETQDLGDDERDEDAAEGMGLNGYQPGSPIGRVHRENIILKRRLRYRNRMIRDLRKALAGQAVV